MPAEPALTTPYGPKQVGGPVPQDQSGPQAAANAGPAAQLPSAQPSSPPPGAAPGEQPPSNPFDQELKKVQTGQKGAHNPFEEMDPNLPMGYTPLTPRLRKAPNGQMEHLRNDGQWAPFGDAENAIAAQITDGLQHFAVRSKEDIPRVVGAIAGTAIATRMGMGPWAEAFLAGGSQAAAGAVGDLLTQGKSPTAGSVATDAAIGGAASLIPSGVGKYLEGKAAARGAEAAISPLVAKGGEELLARHQAEIDAAQAIGAKPGPTQTVQDVAAIRQMGPEAQKLYQMQWGKVAQFKEALANTVSRLTGGTGNVDVAIEKPDFYKVIGNVLKSTGETTSNLKGLAKEVSGDAVHDVDPVLGKMREEITKMLPKGAAIFDDGGRINPQLLADAAQKYPTLFSKGSRELTNVYNELYTVSKTGAGTVETGAFANSTPADKLLEPVGGQSENNIMSSLGEAKPRITPGLTLDEMDAYRAAFGKRANFQGINRDEVNDAYARLHHTMSDHLDTKMIDVLQEQHPEKAAQLMGAKDFYSGIKETAEALQAKVAHDPENAARALIDVKNPVQVKQLWSMITPEQQKNLSGSWLNTLLDPVVDEASGKLRVTTADNAWAKVDPKVKEIMYGKDGSKQIDQLINYAKGINLKAPGAGYSPENDSLMSKFVALAHMKASGIKGAVKFVTSMFEKSPQAQDYVTDKLSGVLMPTGADQVSLAKKQMYMNRASQAMASRWTKYGLAPAVSADIETDHNQVAPQK